MEHRKFDSNSFYSIFPPKFPIILQFYQYFINIHSFQWELAKTKKILNACKNKTSHANTLKNWEYRSVPLFYDDVTKRTMTSANI